MNNQIRNTFSVCPVCLRRLSAEIVKRQQEYFLQKTCPDHGSFEAVIWRGETPSFEHWGNYVPPAEQDKERPECPSECGLCPGHLQKTCCVLIEVTSRCNLSCPVCFAQSGQDSAEPSAEQLAGYFKQLVERGSTFIQLSGGEPTEREDLPDIVAAARAAGCENIQLNSNGIRLGQDRAFTKALAEAGLSFVFMQFDGTNDSIFEKLRGRPLLAEKRAAIEACSEELLGVTLVATLVPGVNDQNVGEILNFGFSNSPAVRGVHFQPISYFGRYPQPPRNEDRITLPELLRAMEKQTAEKVRISDFIPSGCDHPRCGFHADFMVLPEDLVRLSPKADGGCCGQDDGRAHIKNRNFVARRWKRSATKSGQDCCCSQDYSDMDTFLNRVKSHGFTITAMAFQDAYTLDLERLRRCSLHVYRDGRMIPFCAGYLTPETRS
ncbi:MAG TPA: radical SAM protein [Acidobacteriota bacterium]|nr:radical SAM protein [Acidobacteriota bacterium]